MTTKLFERLVTKFSIKVADLIKYLEISKATITVTGDILMHEPLIDAGRKGNSYNFDKFL